MIGCVGRKAAPTRLKKHNEEPAISERSHREKSVFRRYFPRLIVAKPYKTYSITAVWQLRAREKYFDYKTVKHLKYMNF